VIAAPFFALLNCDQLAPLARIYKKQINRHEIKSIFSSTLGQSGGTASLIHPNRCISLEISIRLASDARPPHRDRRHCFDGSVTKLQQFW
jgi:hypothetical protein